MKYYAEGNFYANPDIIILDLHVQNKNSYRKLLRQLAKQCNSTTCIRPLTSNENDDGPSYFTDNEKAERLTNTFSLYRH